MGISENQRYAEASYCFLRIIHYYGHSSRCGLNFGGKHRRKFVLRDITYPFLFGANALRITSIQIYSHCHIMIIGTI